MREIDFTSAVAEYLHVSEAYLDKRRSLGGGPRFFKLEQGILYRKADVDAWLETQLVGNNQELKKKRGRPPKILIAQSRS